MFKKVILLSSVIALSAGTISADDHGKGKKGDRGKMHAQMKEKFDAHFTKRDINGDGAFSHAEMMHRVEENFKKIDKNNDGQVSFDELPKDMSTLATLLGVEKHIVKRVEKRKGKMDPKKGKMKKRKGKPGKGPKAKPHMMKRHMMKGHKMTRISWIAKHDKDASETVSLSEFSMNAIKRFKQSDRNGDGSITKKEAMKAMHSRVRSVMSGMKHGMKSGMRGQKHVRIIKRVEEETK